MNRAALVTIVVIVLGISAVLAIPPHKRHRRNKNQNKKGRGPGGIVISSSGGTILDSDVYNQQQSLSDPADITNLFGQCASDPSVDVKSIFGDMFMSSAELENLVTEKTEEIRKGSGKAKGKSKVGVVEKNRVSKTIGTIQTYSSRSGDSTCCETRLDITAPGLVMVDNEQMPVVHMNHSYQYVQEGICAQPAAPCRDIGICTQIYKYVFMLLYDKALVGKVNPPVRYGRVQMKSHCECMNVGTVLK